MSTPFHIQHALLAMDAYNRGENAALNVPGNRVGDAQFNVGVTNRDCRVMTLSELLQSVKVPQ